MTHANFSMSPLPPRSIRASHFLVSYSIGSIVQHDKKQPIRSQSLANSFCFLHHFFPSSRSSTIAHSPENDYLSNERYDVAILVVVVVDVVVVVVVVVVILFFSKIISDVYGDYINMCICNSLAPILVLDVLVIG
jgi:hypothetical protein